MITFSKLEKHGRLGNQLFQVAAILGFSNKYNCDYVLPEWTYAKYFNKEIKYGYLEATSCIEEIAFHYTPEYWDNFKEQIREANTDMLGWFQTEKYWAHCKQKVWDAFTFAPEFLQETKLRFNKIFSRSTIAISVRRGDYISNPNYYLLPDKYYLGALVNHFPDYAGYNIVFFSDDIRYCRLTIKRLPNFYFVEGASAIEQLCLLSLCNHFIISNSSFSWWGAMLGEQETSKVVRPVYLFDGEFRKSKNIRDYYPERWLAYDPDTDNTNVDTFRTSPFQKNIKEFQIRFQRYLKQILKKFK